MANVKITELTELAAVDVASNDVLPIVDVGADATKKVAISSLQASIADANDFVTFARLDANLNLVQDNVVAAEANVVLVRSNIDSFASTTNTTIGTLSTNLTANLVQATANTDAVETRRADNVFFTLNLTGQPQANIILNDANVEPTSNNTYSLGAPDKVWKDVFIGPGSLKLGDVTISALGEEGISITGASGEQANVTTPSQGGVANVSAELDGLQSRLSTNVIAFTNEDAALQARITANNQTAASNDFITFTRLNANVDVVQDNVATNATDITAVETRRAANVTIRDNEDIALQARIAANAAVAASNDFITFTRLNANVDLIQDNVVAAEANVVLVRSNVDSLGSYSNTTFSTVSNAQALAGEDADLQARLTTNVTSLTNSINTLDANADAIEARRVANVTIRDNEDTALQARITANAAESASNDFITFTRLNANVNVVQDNVAINATDIAAVETRRVANIAGAVSTITTADLTASRAVVSDGSGKIAVSAVTSTEIGHLDGVTSAIQTQIDSKIATVDSASNDFITFTRLNANVDVVQDNVATNATDITALETRRTNNIAGAVSTITTSDLTASRALVSDGSGKVAVSAVTSTEIGHLDGVTSAIQTQLNAVEARRAANLVSATFTGEVSMSDDLIVTGNLTVNGDTTTVNSENKVIQDRFIMLANSVSGAPSADVGILFNRGTSGNAALFYDESAKFFTLSETRDPDTNVAISPTGAANLSVGQFTASSVAFDGADLSTAITDNVATLNTSIAAVETRRTNNIAGAISTVLTSDLTASRALIAGTGGKIEVSDVTSTELGHLDGVTSAIQTQLNSKQATITGAATTIDDTDLTASRALVSDGSGKVAVSAVTATEIGHLDGVSSAIQTQLNGKQATITGAATTIDDTDLTASRALVSDGSGKVAVSAVTSTELGRLDGVTSAIQTQLNAKLESVATDDIDNNAVTVGKLATTLDLGTL